MVRPVRCATVWVAATCAAVGVSRALLPVAAAPGPHFDDRLVAVCAAALIACAAWAWLTTTVVVVEAAGPRRAASRFVPAGWRRLVLLACGVTLAGAMTPAMATPGPVHVLPTDRQEDALLSGLPFPSRPVDTMSTPSATPTHTVSPGDTLWAIAQGLLPAGASDAQVAAATRLLHAVNRAVIGADPDLIQPGQQLRLPPPAGD